MKIEQLLESSLEVLESMSDSELEKHLIPYFTVTRPEFVKEKAEKKEPSKVSIEERMKIEKAKAIARRFGIDLGKL